MCKATNYRADSRGESGLYGSSNLQLRPIKSDSRRERKHQRQSNAGVEADFQIRPLRQPQF